MKKKNTLKEAYQHMIRWNEYRLAQNQQSLEELINLIPKLKEEEQADPIYQADVDDLLSLKIIYETGIRSFEGKIQKYTELIDSI